MGERAIVAGAGLRTGRPGLGPIEHAVKAVVAEALAAAGRGIEAVDLVVTVGSELLDGTMIATRSGIAGAYGRELMTVASSGGHAFAAAVAMIESDAADTVLLAGWGEGTKFAACDARYLQADPFYARPLGADAVALAALQAQRLIADGRVDPAAAEAFGAAMRERAGTPGSFAGTGAWLSTHWCDGACALLLVRSGGGTDGVAVAGVGSAFEPYCPAPERLDPALWVRAALGAAAERDALAPGMPRAIEIGGPTPFSELAARAAFFPDGRVPDGVTVNASGGSAAAFFGPATGLQRIAAAYAQLRGAGGTAVAVDLAGPIGQAATAVILEAGR